jgi:hypothetical protein
MERELDPGELRRLYIDEGWSLSAIGETYGCSLVTIWRRLKAAGIETRAFRSLPRYERADFSGDRSEMAYLIGLRIGDLNVELNGDSVVVKCTSTRVEQIELFRAVFEPYGHVYTDEVTMTRRKRQSIQMIVRLNSTFEFLLPKQDCVPAWILDSNEPFFAFLAGCIDAEGYIRTTLRSERAEVALEIRSYDRVLLTQVGAGLNARGIRCAPACVRVSAGYVNRYGVRSNGDLWGLGVQRRDSLRALFASIDAYLRHPRRRTQMATALLSLLSK